MSAPTPGLNQPEKKRVLVVDDQASSTRLVKLYLEGTHQYVVKEENDPQAAMATAMHFQPHLILLDVMMPGLDGRELVARFQSSSTLKKVPLVFLTSAITKRDVEAQGGRFWGIPSLAKPVVLADIIACLKAQLGTPEAPVQ